MVLSQRAGERRLSLGFRVQSLAGQFIAISTSLVAKMASSRCKLVLRFWQLCQEHWLGTPSINPKP